MCGAPIATAILATAQGPLVTGAGGSPRVGSDPATSGPRTGGRWGRAIVSSNGRTAFVSDDLAAARFAGVYAATTTPFRDDGTVDFGQFGEHCAWLIDEGVAGLIPNGSLGEYEALSDGRTRRDRHHGDRRRGRPGPGRARRLGQVRPGGTAVGRAGRRGGRGAVMSLPPTSHKPTGG